VQFCFRMDYRSWMNHAFKVRNRLGLPSQKTLG
jgi:hypothetical protein